MSMGQKKKALIAFSLATNVKLLMLDEPTNGLDIDSKIQFKYLMTQLSTPDRCILISTHQVKDIENIVDRITVIEDGKLLFQESMENIAQKLCFRYNASLNDNEVVLFSEELLNGKATVTLNQNQEETMVDLELLYKALIHQPASISKIFAHE
jgi:ABC-2 type transport system ATP-binding protein